MLVAAWNNSMAVPPVYACLAHTLATVGIVCAKSDQRYRTAQSSDYLQLYHRHVCHCTVHHMMMIAGQALRSAISHNSKHVTSW